MWLVVICLSSSCNEVFSVCPSLFLDHLTEEKIAVFYHVLAVVWPLVICLSSSCNEVFSALFLFLNHLTEK